MDWQLAPELQKEVKELISSLDFSHVDPRQITVFRSFGSRSRARARIWGLPKIWQQALRQKPHYCLEVISERFDRLTLKERKKVLIHELLHIPKTFSGALLSHRGRSWKIDGRTVEKFWRKLGE